MANWKKVIVSGSSAHLNNVHSLNSAGAAAVSCSGNWFGDLPEADNQEILVVYDTATGQLKTKNLSDFPGAPGSN